MEKWVGDKRAYSSMTQSSALNERDYRLAKASASKCLVTVLFHYICLMKKLKCYVNWNSGFYFIQNENLKY